MKTTLIAALAGVTALTACAQADDWNAHRADMERFSYVGERTPEAVCLYVEETAEAVEYAMQRIDGVQEFYYMPRTGRIAVRLEWPNRMGNYEVRDVFNAFHERRLYVTSITEMRNLGDRHHRDGREYGGRDRVRELSGIPTEASDCNLDNVNFNLGS
jgi:hypothetical protein